jgi:hypothetical protein
VVASRAAFVSERPRPAADADYPFQAQPNSVEDTGIEFGQLLDLCIKTIYYGGRPSARLISARMALPFPIIENLLVFLKREQFVEVVGTSGLGEQQYQYALSGRGQEKAIEALDRNQYVGPTPVTFERYVEVVLEQSVRKIRVDIEAVESALSDLVLNDTTRNLVGPAVNSGRSILLYGDPGNGKSSIAKAISNMLPGQILVPHAIDINGQTVKVFDPRVHKDVSGANDDERRIEAMNSQNGERRRDLRWALCARPVIMVGGELTLADLELRYSPQSKFYIGSLQIKANCGILVVDDFGRQLVQPKELLNRWIVPMENRVDHLTLLSGDTVELPFECLLVFSTNLPPHSLGDEAFFRRIRHKIEVGDPDEQSFLRILEIICESRGIPYAAEAGRYLIEKWYKPRARHFRGVHPRDLCDLLMDIASYQGKQAAFTPEWIDLACASYFIDQPT